MGRAAFTAKAMPYLRWAAPMKAHHWGSMDGLAFNNVRIEIAWPGRKRLVPF